MSIPPNSSEGIFRTLKEEILNLTLKPGQAPSENEVCTRFGVSRTPVRSVLQRLQAEGLVDVVPYKGTTVTLLRLDDIEQRIYMRIASCRDGDLILPAEIQHDKHIFPRVYPAALGTER